MILSDTAIKNRMTVLVACVLFVAAGVEHRFEDFGDDLLVWRVFYGPAGGEASR